MMNISNRDKRKREEKKGNQNKILIFVSFRKRREGSLVENGLEAVSSVSVVEEGYQCCCFPKNIVL